MRRMWQLLKRQMKIFSGIFREGNGKIEAKFMRCKIVMGQAGEGCID